MLYKKKAAWLAAALGICFCSSNELSQAIEGGLQWHLQKILNAVGQLIRLPPVQILKAVSNGGP